MHRHALLSLAFVSALSLPLLFHGGLLQPQSAAGATISCSAGLSGCHFSPAVSDGTGRNVPSGQFPGSHVKHSGAAAGQYAYACTRCHPSGAYTNSHQSGYKNITGISLPGTSYTQGKKIPLSFQNNPTFGNCSVTYCHSSGQASNGTATPAYVAATWGGTAGCGSCHVNFDSSGSATGNHVKHAQTYSISCASCHNGYTETTVTTATHVNQLIETAFSGTLATGTTYSQANGAVGNGYGNCTTSYCHSTGQASNGTATPTYVSATWGGTAGCGNCHANMDTDGAAPGNHVKHAQTYSISCASCHNGYTETTVATATHVNKLIETTFSGTLATGTTYTQANQTVGNGYGTCSTSYCHSTGQSTTGGATPTYPATPPAWGGAALNCGSCHVDMDSNASATGDHVMHAQTKAIACATCHNGYTETTVNSATHVNKIIELDFSGSTVATGTVYSGGTTNGDHSVGGGFGSCTTSYCHSTGQASNGTATPTYLNPTWNTAALNCGSCHLNFDSNASATGDHVKHAQGTANLSCATCHNGYTEGTAPNATHINKTIEISFSGTNATGTTYSQGSGAVGNGYGNCSTSKCHGSGAPVWGGALYSATVICENCHGSAATSPFYSTAATGAAPTKTTAENDSKVGAHLAHLTARAAYTNAVACGDCHAVPATVTAAGHMEGSATPTFSGDAVLNGASPTYATSTCSNTYCHGAKMINLSNNGSDTSPTWTNTAYLTGTPSKTGDCVMCHGCPPNSGGHGGSETLAECNGCHSHVNTDGTFTAGANRGLHLNGIVEASSDCNGCHNAVKSVYRRQVVGALTADFDITAQMSNMTSHVKTANIDVKTCEVCHAQSSHKTYTDGVNVKLWNTRATSGTGTIVYDGTTRTLNNFCIGCHDSAGFSNIANMRPSGSTATATTPYADSGDNKQPVDIFTNWSAGAITSNGLPTGTRKTHQGLVNCMDCHGDNQNNSTTTPRINAHASKNGRFLRYSTTTKMGYGQTCFNKTTGCHGPGSTLAYTGARVYSQFKVNNASAGTGGAHPILEAVTPKSSRISGDTAGATFVNGWKSNSIATCSDCHGSPLKNGPRGPHGSSQPYLLKALQSSTAGGSVAYPTTHTNGTALSTTGLTLTNAAAFCLNCHAADIYGDGNGTLGTAAGTRLGHGSVNKNKSSCLDITVNLMGNSCQSCHCGKGYDDGSPTALEKGTHSTTAPVATTVSNVGFTNGNNWTKAPDTTTGCYATEKSPASPAYTSGWGTCGQGPHNGSDSRFKKNIDSIINPLRKLFATDLARYRQDGNIPVLVETVREQQRNIEAQQHDIDEIKSMIRELNR